MREVNGYYWSDQDLFNKDDFKYNESLMIDDKSYNKVYNFGKFYTSREKGIIKYSNDSIILSIVE